MTNDDWWLVIHPIRFTSKNQCHILILMSLFVSMTAQKIFTYSLYYYLLCIIILSSKTSSTERQHIANCMRYAERRAIIWMKHDCIFPDPSI